MRAYQERLKILNAADFGDLLLENIRLFREHPDVLRQYQNRFKFILVDEYQDTNVAQYLWLRLLAQAPSLSSNLVPARSPPSCGEVDARTRESGEAGFSALDRDSRESSLTPALSPQAGRGSRSAPLARPPKTSAASAMTTSRSMAGAAPRSTTSCASSTIFPAPR